MRIESSPFTNRSPLPSAERRIDKTTPPHPDRTFQDKRSNELRRQLDEVFLLLASFLTAGRGLPERLLPLASEREAINIQKTAVPKADSFLKTQNVEHILPLVDKLEITNKWRLDTSTLESKGRKLSTEERRIFLTMLRIWEMERETLFQKRFDDAIKDLSQGKDISILRNKLDQRTISLTDQHRPKHELKHFAETFPSGNFLFHSTNVESLLNILRDKQLITSEELRQTERKDWGRGGEDGIAFNMNGVRVLTGDSKHFVGFLTSPETALNGPYKLEVPFGAAELEVRLVPEHSHNETWRNMKRIWQQSFLAQALGIPINLVGKKRLKDLPRLSVEDMYVVCNERDAQNVKKILALQGLVPKGILTYPNTALRVESWLIPTGDHREAGKLLRDALARAGKEPTIEWERDLFPHTPSFDGPILTEEDRHASKVIRRDEQGKLRIDTRNPQKQDDQTEYSLIRADL